MKEKKVTSLKIVFKDGNDYSAACMTGLDKGEVVDWVERVFEQELAAPLIKDEKIRKAVRAWAEALEIGEAEFYGSATWIGLRTRSDKTGWLSKLELDNFGTENTLVPFRRYTIEELCGEDEE